MRNVPSSMRSRYLPWQLAQVAPSGVIEVLAASMLLMPRFIRIESACLLAVGGPASWPRSLPLAFQNASVSVNAVFRMVACSLAQVVSLPSSALRRAAWAGGSLVMIFCSARSSADIGGIGFLAMSMPAVLMTAVASTTGLPLNFA